MFGTWHPTREDSSPTDSSPSASDSSTHSRFGSARARPIDGRALVVLVGSAGRELDDHVAAQYCSVCATTQVAMRPRRRRSRRTARPRAADLYHGRAMTRSGPRDRCRRIEAAREAIAGRVHRTPLLAPGGGAPGGVDSRDPARRWTALFLKAEHLQKTGSFKPRGMTARVAALTAEERAARDHHDLGRQRRAGVRIRGTRSASP